MTKVITFYTIQIMKNKILVPVYKKATQFLRGESAKIFNEVSKSKQDVIVLKSSEPHVVIISYSKYRKLEEEGKI